MFVLALGCVLSWMCWLLCTFLVVAQKLTGTNISWQALLIRAGQRRVSDRSRQITAAREALHDRIMCLVNTGGGNHGHASQVPQAVIGIAIFVKEVQRVLWFSFTGDRRLGVEQVSYIGSWDKLQNRVRISPRQR